MHIGVPRAIKVHEYRVGLVPAGVRDLVGAVLIAGAAAPKLITCCMAVARARQAAARKPFGPPETSPGSTASNAGIVSAAKNAITPSCAPNCTQPEPPPAGPWGE